MLDTWHHDALYRYRSSSARYQAFPVRLHLYLDILARDRVLAMSHMLAADYDGYPEPPPHHQTGTA